MSTLKKINSQGITLIELLIAISIAAILFGVVTFTLSTTLDTFHFVQDDIFLQKTVDEILQVVSDGDFETYGLKDSLEVIDAKESGITFIPLWVDDSHTFRSQNKTKQEFVLNRPFKAGSSLPIGEVLVKGAKESYWKAVPISFFLGEQNKLSKGNDRVRINAPVKLGSKVRFMFHPDVKYFPESSMTIKLLDSKLLRIYEKRSESIPRYEERGVVIRDLRFEYFDNANNKIPVDGRKKTIAKDQLANITAVRLVIKAVLGKKTKKGSVFVNLRNTRSSGSGLILREGTKVKIPNSKNVRALSLVNIIGIKNGGRIILDARSKVGQSWRINIELGLKDGQEIIKKYSIDYPIGLTVFSETLNLSTSLPLNFLALGGSGRYDYDLDSDVENVVNLKGDIELKVVQLDAAGASLFIRP